MYFEVNMQFPISKRAWLHRYKKNQYCTLKLHII
jgi:hypothetical protein